MSVVREGDNLLKLKVALKELDDQKASVGWYESAHYPGGTPVAYVASIHEFGAPGAGIPPRPFMRPAMAQYGPAWMVALGDGVKSVLRGGMSATQLLEAVTARAAGDVAKSIQAVTAPALKPATIRRKGFAKPLVDTGQMVQSVTNRVGPDA